MPKIKALSLAVAGAALASSAGFSPALADSPLKVGKLDCTVSEVDKSLIETHMVLDCKFTGLDGAALTTYEAQVCRKPSGFQSLATL